jgi:hypothetical protein
MSTILDFTSADSGAPAQRHIVYCSVKFQVGWLPGALGFTEAAKAALASELGIDKRVIRGSYAILGASRDPLIQQGAALKRLMTTIRSQFTIPEYTLVATASQESEIKTEKVSGSYLIEACRVEEFLSRFNEVREQYLAWGRQVSEPENYNRLREADEEALGKDWLVVAPKYPTAAQLSDSVTCDFPRIEPFDASFTLADVSPETARMLKEQAEARLEASVDGAISEIILEFKNLVEAVARNCGKRVRLLPATTHPYSRLRYAEVQQILRHADNPQDIPQGTLLVTVQQCTPRSDDPTKFTQTGKAESLLITESEYSELRPYETDENKILAQSSFDNLLWLANKIQSVKSMLGSDSYAENLTQLAEEVSATLGSLGGSASEITKQLRNSSFARQQAKATFNDFLTKLTTQEMEIKAQGKGLRRKIKVGGGTAS